MAVFSSISWSLTLAQDFLGRRLSDGAIAIDATMGGGHDTLFLARCVGPAGRVFAFDIQEAALELTRERLEKNGLLDRTQLILASHSAIQDHVHEAIQAAVFNLGYLPKGDRSILTEPQSTIPALEACAALLAPEGGIAAVAYRGHPEGIAELAAVEAWCAGLDPDRFYAVKREALNHPRSPVVFLIEAAADVAEQGGG